MSLGQTDAASTTLSPDNLTMPARIWGIIRRPRRTFEAVLQRPRWAPLMLVLAVVSFASSAAVVATDVGEQALVDQWERTTLAFGGEIDDAEYARLQELSERYAVAYAGVSALARGPLAAFAVAALASALFRALRSRPGFRRTLTVVVHAGVILTVRDVIAAPLNYAREALTSPLTALAFAGTLDEASPAARFLAAIDLFVVWWVVTLSIGLAVLSGQRTRTIAWPALGLYAAVGLALAIAMALLGNG